ncbi:hypothetical protein ES705_38318 [subsurface metagenome]
MQEILEDGSEGKAFVENTIEDLLPHIKKSLEDPKVKYVKVFRGKKLGQIPFEDKEEFIAEEEKCDVIEEILNEDEEKKKTQLRIPGKR